jgi:SAM-dependent methyltransferase
MSLPARRSFARALLMGALAAMLALGALLLWRQLSERPEHAPHPGRIPPGTELQLDAPYVPTEHAIVAAMLRLGNVGSDDYVIDLGSGDGRILIAAARDHGARGLGVDIDPARIRDSNFNARAAGVTDRVAFRRQDLFETPLGRADVLTLYLLPEINLRLRPRILAEMRPGTRVVSHAFDMGEWRWDRRELVDGANIYMWIVPADLNGEWRLRLADGRTARLTLEQTFQALTGSASVGGRVARLERGLVSGTRMRFVADLGDGRRVYDGRVDGNRIVPLGEGRPSYPLPPAVGWRAERGR